MPIFGGDSTTSATSSRSSTKHSSRHPSRHPSLRIFSSRSSQTSVSPYGITYRRRGAIRHTPKDPTIKAAKDRVFRAETAEREADRALIVSRRAVKEARNHVKNLEREAAEEVRLAKIKQDQVRSISKRAKPLGRNIQSPSLMGF